MILAIDTSLGALSACVLDPQSDSIVSQETMVMERGYAEALIPLLDRVMAEVPQGLSVLTRVCVAVGPGSFTGIRVGLSAARAIALAGGLPVVGVSTLSAFAAPVILSGQEGITIAAIDARQGRVYATAFGQGGRPLFEPRMATAREIIRAVGSGPLAIVGSAAPALAIEAWSSGVTAEVQGQTSAPDIAWVARLGLVADPALAPARPLYMRGADVKPAGAPLIAHAPA